MEWVQYNTADDGLEILLPFAGVQGSLPQHRPKPAWIMRDDSLLKANDYMIRCSNEFMLMFTTDGANTGGCWDCILGGGEAWFSSWQKIISTHFINNNPMEHEHHT